MTENDNGYVSIHENILPVSLIEKIKEIPSKQRTHRLNLTSWDSQVVGMSGAIILYDIEGELKNDLVEHIKKFFCIPNREFHVEAVYTLGSHFSFIPWHDDSIYFLACTVYLNKSWDMNWGGAFIYEDGDCLKAIYPKFNNGIILKPPVMHTTSIPSMNAPLRQSLQLFFREVA